MRGRLLILVAIAVLVPSTAALGSRIEVGGAQFNRYTGHDAFGKVTFGYSFLPTHLSHPPVVNVVTLQNFRFANECSRSGTKVPGVIRIRGRRFDYHAHGFIVKGRLIGPFLAGGTSKGPQFVGTAQQLHDCDGETDVLPFVALPPR